MPYVILKKDGKPFNSHIVFTKTEIDRLADDGHEYIVLNTSTRQKSKDGAGFWDGDWDGAKGSPRGSSGAARRLTDSSHAYGSYDLHYNDSDGKIYGGDG